MAASFLLVIALEDMKVSGAGNDQPRRPEDELPIDINYAKFADWLTDRQKIKGDWRNALRLIQQKVGQSWPEKEYGIVWWFSRLRSYSLAFHCTPDMHRQSL